MSASDSFIIRDAYRLPSSNFESLAEGGDSRQIVLEVAERIAQLTVPFAVVGIELEKAATGADDLFDVIHVACYLRHHVPATLIVGKQTAKGFEGAKGRFELHALILNNAPIVTVRRARVSF